MAYIEGQFREGNLRTLWKRLVGFLPPYAKSPTRLYLLLAVVGIAAIIVLEGGIFSLHVLSVVAVIVIAIGCVTYTPPRSLPWLATIAASVWSFSDQNHMKDWQKLALLVAVGFCWISWLIYHGVHLILNSLRELDEKVDILQEKIHDLEV
jgi:hypothetical protein